MSLSTQLARGTLALPMLVLFGALALVAARRTEARDGLPSPPPTALVMQQVGSAVCANLPRAPMLLAQAPGDLGPLAQRVVRNGMATSCRA